MWKKLMKNKENLSTAKRWQLVPARKPVATKQLRQSSPQSNPVSKMFAPIDQRKWNDVPAVHYVIEGSLSWRV